MVYVNVDKPTIYHWEGAPSPHPPSRFSPPQWSFCSTSSLPSSPPPPQRRLAPPPRHLAVPESGCEKRCRVLTYGNFTKPEKDVDLWWFMRIEGYFTHKNGESCEIVRWFHPWEMWIEGNTSMSDTHHESRSPPYGLDLSYNGGAPVTLVAL